MVRSKTVIESKVAKSERSNEKENDDFHHSVTSNNNIATVERNDAFPVTSDDHRKAEIAERRVSHSHPIPKRRINVSSLIFNSPVDQDPFAMFPDDNGLLSYHALYTKLTDNQRQSYLVFKRSDANVPFILFFYLSSFFFMITGFIWAYDSTLYRQYPTSTISIVCAVVTAFFLFWIGLNHMVSLSGQCKFVCVQWYYRFVMKLYKSPYGQWPDNCVCIFASLACAFYLVNVVIMNQCHTTTNISNNITCVPTTVPPEAMILTMLSIVMVQIVARGISRIALVCSWVICLVAINVAIYLSGNSNYVWINLLQTLIIGISYELERQPLRQFIKTAAAREAAKVAAELELQLSTYKTLLASEALESKRALVSDVFV